MKISIITATFNSEDYVLDAIDSYSKQNYVNKELIIVDGCSTDNTINLIQSSKYKIDKLIIESDDGIYSALNKGINSATGEIIGFLHSDDYYPDNFVLSNVINAFLENDSKTAVYGNLDYINNRNSADIFRSWKSKSFKSHFLNLGWMPPHPSLFVRTQWYRKICGFNEKYSISSDYDAILKLFSDVDFAPLHLDITLMNMRTGGISNGSLSNIFKKSLEDFLILRDNKFSFLNSLFILFMKNISKIGQIKILKNN